MSCAWVDGLYSHSKEGRVIWTVDIKGGEGYMTAPGQEEEEEGRMALRLKSGVFTNTDRRGLELTGQDHYDIEIYDVLRERDSHGVVSEGGRKITLMNGDILELLDKEGIEKLKTRDPADDPPNNYTPQPDNMGPIFWISGLAGMGKTTTAKILQEKEEFVNYEGDCFMMGLNPYVGAAPQGFSYFGTRSLSGIPQDRKDICKMAMEKGYKEILKGNPVDPKVWEDFYTLLCDDILRERRKLGGGWVVGQGIYTKTAREVVRKRLGDDLTMIVLEDGENIQVERLAARALGSGEISQEARKAAEERMATISGGHEAVEQDEVKTYAINVTKAMTPEDIARLVLNQK